MSLIPTRPVVEKRVRHIIRPTAAATKVWMAYAEFKKAPGDLDYVLDTLGPRLPELEADFRKYLADNPAAGDLKPPQKSRSKSRGRPGLPPAESRTKS